MHPVRAVHRGLPDPVADHEQRVRAGPRQPAGSHLHQGDAARTAAAGDGAAAARDAAGPRREGLLRRCADRPGYLGGCGGDVVTSSAILAAASVGTGEAVTFWILAPIAVLGAVGMVWARNAIHSALFLVLTMLSLGVFYVLQAGPFIGMVQIIVYTGAIIMLFLFVLMLVGRDASDALIETLRGQRTAAIVLGIGFAGLLCTVLARGLRGTAVKDLTEANKDGNVQGIANLLFTKYVFAFEGTSA